ncbi:AKAP7 2'5' RNA ligase-like domain-containing protein [Irpex rosettiformis]|uniref:AKAP7 2'5' RNA ligase-like domain-containing protein n=1 Tax=Irpex rosettiformis TaxID=378272 RepID=A0ACB8UCE2_9APHY|nr:AKAP7 2'5' RNA ligase-like domain-containing protein [Irpex rosettiformis]
MLVTRLLTTFCKQPLHRLPDMSYMWSHTHSVTNSERLAGFASERPPASYHSSPGGPPLPARAHGPRLGRGGRGRGRGRGGVNATPSANQHTERLADNHGSGNPVATQERPRPTHFISLPIGHHPELRKRMTAFTKALLAQDPQVPGLDDTILVSPRRMHITLGVMNLVDSSHPGAATFGTNALSLSQPAVGSTSNQTPQPKTVQSAVQFLTALRPRIVERLAGQSLQVGLNSMDIMHPERGDLTKAHIMWAGPSYESEQARRLKHVCVDRLYPEFIHNEFKRAGFVVDDRRPLKIHCTVINTSHRKGRRQPFSYADVIASRAFRSIETGPEIVDAPQHARGRKPIAIDLGEWRVDELQICKMGSWGPEGEYVSVGKISLR